MARGIRGTAAGSHGTSHFDKTLFTSYPACSLSSLRCSSRAIRTGQQILGVLGTNMQPMQPRQFVLATCHMHDMMNSNTGAVERCCKTLQVTLKWLPGLSSCSSVKSVLLISSQIGKDPNSREVVAHTNVLRYLMSHFNDTMVSVPISSLWCRTHCTSSAGDVSHGGTGSTGRP